MIIKAYHGTNARFDKFDRSKARIKNDLYGGGIAYFTDDITVAKSYARSMTKKEGIPLVYEVELNLKKVFDVEHMFTGLEVANFTKGFDIEAFARGARLMSGSNRLQILTELKSNKIPLTGEQIFKGLSNGMNQTAKARAIIERQGFDSLRHKGGEMGITPIKHNVYLAYDPGTIRIAQRYIVKPKNDTMNTKESFMFV